MRWTCGWGRRFAAPRLESIQHRWGPRSADPSPNLIDAFVRTKGAGLQHHEDTLYDHEI